MYSYTYDDDITITTIEADNIGDFIDLLDDVLSIDTICDYLDDCEDVWQELTQYSDYID